MGGTCGTHGRINTKYKSENLKGRKHLVNVGVDGRLKMGKQSLKK
jgi:hypothetical protein